MPPVLGVARDQPLTKFIWKREDGEEKYPNLGVTSVLKLRVIKGDRVGEVNLVNDP